MKFKELLDGTTWVQIEESLKRIYNVSDINLEGYMSVVQNLSTLTPKESNMRICIDWVPPDGNLVEEGYWDIHGRNGTLQKDTEDFQYFKDNCSEEVANSEVTYALEFNKWEDWLGMEIDPETVNNINLMKSDIVANILWEMTYISYNEEEIQEEFDEIKRRVDEIKNMSEEDLKKNTIDLDELKKRIEERKTKTDSE